MVFLLSILLYHAPAGCYRDETATHGAGPILYGTASGFRQPKQWLPTTEVKPTDDHSRGLLSDARDIWVHYAKE